MDNEHDPKSSGQDSEDLRSGQHPESSDDRSADIVTTSGESPEISASEFRRIVLYSLLTGLGPLIPIPFLDDWAVNTLRKRLTYELSERHGVALESSGVSILATGETEITVKGCLKGCFAVTVIKPIVKIVIKLLQKVFRKILFFLTIKDCVDTFSHTFHESYLTSHVFCCHMIGGSKEECRTARQAIEEVTREVDPRPVEKLARQVFRGSRKVLFQASRLLAKMMARLRSEEQVQDRPQDAAAPLDTEEQEEVLGSVVDRLADSLSSERGYLRDLRQRLDGKLADRPAVDS